MGYRGFGVLGQEIDVAASNQAEAAPAPAKDDQPPEAAIEPAGALGADEPQGKAQDPDGGAEPLDFAAPEDAPEAASLDADGSESAPALPEAGETTLR